MAAFCLVYCEWNGFFDFEAVAFKGHHPSGVIRQYPDAAEAEVYEDLGADSALALNGALSPQVLLSRLTSVEADRRQGGWLRGAGVDLETAARLVEVNEHSAMLIGYGCQRLVDGGAAIAGGGCEYVAGKAVRVDADQRRSFCGCFSGTQAARLLTFGRDFPAD